MSDITIHIHGPVTVNVSETKPTTIRFDEDASGIDRLMAGIIGGDTSAKRVQPYEGPPEPLDVELRDGGVFVTSKAVHAALSDDLHRLIADGLMTTQTVH